MTDIDRLGWTLNVSKITIIVLIILLLFYKVMLTSALIVLINNSIKKNLLKKAINILTAIFISHKSNIKIFLK